MDKPIINIGEIRNVEGENDKGHYQFFSIDLKQDVDLYYKGKKLDFQTIELPNGAKISRKTVNVTGVDDAVENAKKALDNGKLSEEAYTQITERYEKKDVRYLLSVSNKNLA